MNLCKFIVDHEVTCKTTLLGQTEEGKTKPVKIVFPDAVVKNSFMKNLNKLKNPSDQFNSSDIICFLEVKPKNSNRMLSLVEFTIDGYLWIDSRRGMLVYIKHNI